MTTSTATLLSRSVPGVVGATAAPVRIVHLGLGAFHRAHQAWYTATVDTAQEWGIAAFTGRNPQAANELAPQDGLFTMIERSVAGDTASIVTSIVDAVDGSRLDRLLELLAAPTTSIVTLTITEAGYRLTPDGMPNRADSAVVADIEWLSTNLADGIPSSLDRGPTSSLGRLVLGLEARRLAGAGPIAIVPCDNMPDNGKFVATGVLAMAAEVSDDLAAWIEKSVSFVSTSVDRITPRTTPDDLETAEALTGLRDNAAVVTEPFSDWVLSGEFPAGRPHWENAGARFVDEIEPFERRKLWLLNGAHSLLAYAGRLRGQHPFRQRITEICVLDLLEQRLGLDIRKERRPRDPINNQLPAFRSLGVGSQKFGEEIFEQHLLVATGEVSYHQVDHFVAENLILQGCCGDVEIAQLEEEFRPSERWVEGCKVARAVEPKRIASQSAARCARSRDASSRRPAARSAPRRKWARRCGCCAASGSG